MDDMHFIRGQASLGGHFFFLKQDSILPESDLQVNNALITEDILLKSFF